MGRLTGKVALVTGAGLGMGRVHARLLAAEGAHVVATDINEVAVRQTADSIVQAGGEALWIKHDVACANEWKHVVAASMERFGKVDILVNNAAIVFAKSIEETEEDEWDRLMAVNVKGVFLGCKYIVPAMKSGAGSIINVSSMWGFVGVAGYAAYVASKGGVRMLTKAAAADLYKFGIRVNSLHPGVIANTEMTRDVLTSRENTLAALGSAIFDRPGTPEEVSAAMLFLASDESSYMTGSEVVVDGGYTAR
jgi:cyclopentanol dehydrogenase